MNSAEKYVQRLRREAEQVERRKTRSEDRHHEKVKRTQATYDKYLDKARAKYQDFAVPSGVNERNMYDHFYYIYRYNVQTFPYRIKDAYIKKDWKYNLTFYGVLASLWPFFYVACLAVVCIAIFLLYLAFRKLDMEIATFGTIIIALVLAAVLYISKFWHLKRAAEAQAICERIRACFPNMEWAPRITKYAEGGEWDWDIRWTFI